MKDKIKVGLAGFGTAGRLFHAPFIEASEHFELSCVYERSRDEARKLYPHVRRVDSFEKLLESDCGLIVICVPNDLHYAYTKAALLAGKNVLCDKPFCATREEARELGDLAREKGLFLTVYQNRRFDSEIRTVREILERGKLGSVVDFSLSVERFQKKRNPKEWKNLPGATGILYDLGIHLIDSAYYLFGMPESVFCTLRTQHPWNTVSDRMDLLLFYPGGLTARLCASQCAVMPSDTLVCHGREGSFIKHGCDIQEKLLNAGIRPGDPQWIGESPEAWGTLASADGTKEKYPTVDGDYGEFYRLLYEGFSTGVMPVDPVDAGKVLQILEAAQRSHEEKRTIPV